MTTQVLPHSHGEGLVMLSTTLLTRQTPEATGNLVCPREEDWGHHSKDPGAGKQMRLRARSAEENKALLTRTG